MWQDVEGEQLAEGQNYCNTGAEQTPTQTALPPAPTEYPENSYYQQGNQHHSVLCEPHAVPDDVTAQSGFIGYGMPRSYPGLLDAKQTTYQGGSRAIYKAQANFSEWTVILKRKPIRWMEFILFIWSKIRHSCCYYESMKFSFSINGFLY
jgi:hypothetical protein